MPQRGDAASSDFTRKIVNLVFDRWPVNIERRARSARLRDFEQRTARAQPVANAQRTNIDTARRQVLTHGAVKYRIAARRQIVDNFRCDQQNRLTRAAVNRGMRVAVAFETHRIEESKEHRTLRQTAG